MSSSLNATARVQTQAARNVNDGISFLNVADGATSALKDILFRLRELSTQSSNGTFSNAQRQSIDKESQALQAEYGRILDTTSFNGIRVFGSGDVVVQAGVGVDAAILVKLASAETTNKGDGTFQAKQSFGIGSGALLVAVDDFNGDGKSDLAAVRFRWRQHRERAARQRQRNVSGQADLRHAEAGLAQLLWPTLTATARATWLLRTAAATPRAFCSATATERFRPSSPSARKRGLTLLPWPTSTATARVTWLSRTGGKITVSVLLGNGDGTFQAKRDFGTGSYALAQSQWTTSTATARATWLLRAASATPRACCWATATGRFRPSSPSAPEMHSIAFRQFHAPLERYRGLQTVLIVSVSSRTAHRLLTASSCNAS